MKRLVTLGIVALVVILAAVLMRALRHRSHPFPLPSESKVSVPAKPGVESQIVSKVEIYPTSQFDTTNIVIAIGIPTWRDAMSEVDSALFKVEEVLRGSIRTNQISVGWYTSGIGRISLPERAILVLTSTDSETEFDAIGRNPSKGIIPDTPENRRRVLTASADDLTPVPAGHWLTAKEAVSVVQAYLMPNYPHLTNATWRAVRKGYTGWNIGASCGGWSCSSIYVVGDDGTIKFVARSM